MTKVRLSVCDHIPDGAHTTHHPSQPTTHPLPTNTHHHPPPLDGDGAGTQAGTPRTTHHHPSPTTHPHQMETSCHQ